MACGVSNDEIFLGFCIMDVCSTFDWHGAMMQRVSLSSTGTAFIHCNDCSRPTSRCQRWSPKHAPSLAVYWLKSSRQISLGSFKVAHETSDRQAPAYMSVTFLLITSKQHSLGLPLPLSP